VGLSALLYGCGVQRGMDIGIAHRILNSDKMFVQGHDHSRYGVEVGITPKFGWLSLNSLDQFVNIMIANSEYIYIYIYIYIYMYCGEFLELTAEPVSFSRRTLLHGVSKYVCIYIYIYIYKESKL